MNSLNQIGAALNQIFTRDDLSMGFANMFENAANAMQGEGVVSVESDGKHGAHFRLRLPSAGGM